MLITTLAMVSALLVAVPGSFKPHSYRYTGGRYGHELFRYQLFVPDSLEPGKRYPLLVWLHGFGEAGSDNQQHLAYMDLMTSSVADYCKFFVLAVQCPADNPMWCRGHGGDDADANKDDMIAVAAEILQKTMREYPVDQDRVYLSGVSSGGSGCWEMALRYPEWFAAVAPMASGGGDVSRAANLTGIPIWAFHNADDTLTSPRGVERMVAAVAATGGNVYLSLLTGDGHDCWSSAIGQHHVMAWMLEQRRGAPSWTPPNCRPWQWWHILILPCALLVYVRLSWSIEQRRRRVAAATVATESEATDTDFSIGPILAECERDRAPAP